MSLTSDLDVWILDHPILLSFHSPDGGTTQFCSVLDLL